MKKGRTGCGWLALSAALLLLDYGGKQWADAALKGAGRLVVLPGVLALRYAENTGAAFSALSNATGLLSVVSIAVCAAAALWMVLKPNRWVIQLPLSLVLAGGMGNLIDRIARGYVVDYFELLFMRFAIFNLADVFITVGAMALVIALLTGGDEIARMGRE